MHEQPAGLDDKELATILVRQWELAVTGLTYLPVGFGGYHWLAADRAGSRWFVTVNDLPGAGNERARADVTAAMETAASLTHAADLDFVVGPVRTRRGHPVAWLRARYAVTVFPYSDGAPSGFGDVLTGRERTTLIRMLAALHKSTAVSDTTAVPVRRMELAERDVLTQSLMERATPWLGGPYAEPARALLAEYGDDLARALARFDVLVQKVSADGRSLVITHGEPHPGNLLRARTGLLLVDWDTVGLARPERDLWWVLTSEGQEAACYTELTGQAISADALDLYRLRWTLDDISLFLAEFPGLHQQTPDTELSWSGFRDGLIALAAS